MIINFAVAALGGTVDIELLNHESFEVKVPAGTQSGSVLTFPGKGAPPVSGRGRPGVLHVVVHVRVPERMSRKAKKLIKELANELDSQVVQRSSVEMNA